MLYIVSVQIDRARAESWRAWMADDHIPELLETGCFDSAWMARDEAADTDAREAWRMFYVLKSAEALETYLRDHAPALKRDHAERYAGSVSASREILEIAHRYTV